MEVFDQPTRAASCGGRECSTHAPQALELLNGRMSNGLAKAFAQRLERELRDHRADQIDRAFRLTTGRLPSEKERRLAVWARIAANGLSRLPVGQQLSTL